MDQSLLTLKLKLLPDPAQHDALLETMERFNAACNDIAAVAFRERSANKVKLQHLVYRDIRERFGLSAQLTIRAIAKVAGAYKGGGKKRPAFDPHGAIVYDQRILSFKALNRVSILTLKGRQLIPLVVCDYHAGLLGAGHMRGQAGLVSCRGKWYLYLVVSVPTDRLMTQQGALGVDLGIANLATDSDGDTYSGEAVEQKRRIYAHRRRNLQRKGSRSARRKLRKIAGQQARFQANTNHCISKAIVRKAHDTGRSIVLEDLQGIRGRTTVHKRQRARHANWAFRQLRSFIAYKAALSGVPLGFCNPRNTSKTCSRCGHCERANRRSQASFLCVWCGFAAPADHNAAVNIARANVMWPMVAPSRAATSRLP
jgi:IS605 OrfB family transposase